MATGTVRLMAPTIVESFARMMDEIIADVQRGKVPKTVRNFAELHNYVDANEYGGFCEDETLNALLMYYGGRGADDSLPDGLVEHISSAQGAVDVWLRLGYLPRAKGIAA